MRVRMFDHVVHYLRHRATVQAALDGADALATALLALL